MNCFLKHLAILIPLFFTFDLCGTLTSKGDQVGATEEWEQHSEGVDLRILLTVVGQEHVLEIDIKNTTGHAISFVGIELYYINAADEAVLIFSDDYTHINRPIHILSGKSWHQTLALSPDKLKLVKTHPVFIAFTFHDPEAKQQYSIKSVPKLLTETVSN
jgi:hypothetical protein